MLKGRSPSTTLIATENFLEKLHFLKMLKLIKYSIAHMIKKLLVEDWVLYLNEELPSISVGVYHMLNQIARIAAALVLSALAVPAMAQVQERIVRTGSIVETHRLDVAAGTYTWSVCEKAIVPNGSEQVEKTNCMSQTRKVTSEEAAAFAQSQTHEMLSAVHNSRSLKGNDISDMKARAESASLQIQSNTGGSMVKSAFQGMGQRVSSIAKSVGNMFSSGESTSAFEKAGSSVSDASRISDQAQQRKD